MAHTDPVDIGTELITPLKPYVIVLFGASGDLARRKLLPGMFHLARAGLLPEYRIVGTSLDVLDTDGFRAFARQALADPDWFAKVKAGRGSEVRLCEYTNYCEGLDQKHKVVTCQLWDREAMDEAGIAKTPDGKRRLVAPRWNK